MSETVDLKSLDKDSLLALADPRKSNNPRAQIELGQRFADENNFDEALIWFRRAALQGDRKAQNSMGLFCYNGAGTDPNADKAYFWWAKAAAKGSRKAMYNLGIYFADPDRMNSTAAMEWFEKAAALDLPQAKLRLASILCDGPDHLRNYDRAFALYNDVISSPHISQKPELLNIAQENMSILMDRVSNVSASRHPAAHHMQGQTRPDSAMPN